MEVQFLQWTKDMTQGISSFSKNGINADQASIMMKCKNSEKIISYLVKHFRPHTELQHIKLNLKHAEIKKNLLDESNETNIDNKMNLLSTQIQETQSQIESEAKDLLNIAEEEETLRLQENELKRKIALLRIASLKTSEETNKIKSWHLQLQPLVDNRRRNSGSISPQEQSIKNQAIKESLLSITSELQMLRQQLMNDKLNKNDIATEKLRISAMVATLLAKESPSDVLTALKSITEQSTEEVVQITKQVDLAKDAKLLRLKYESSGKLLDDLEAEGILETIQMLLLEMSGKHLRVHLANNKTKRDLKFKEEVLDNFKRNIRNLMQQQIGDSEKVSATMEFIEELLSISGMKASVDKMMQVSENLEKRQVAALRAREALLAKHKKIHSYSNQAKLGNDHMRSLNTSIGNNWQLLKDQLNAIRSHVDSETDSLELPTPFLERRIATEMESLDRIPLDLLLTEDPECPIRPVGPLQSFFLRSDNDAPLLRALSDFSPTISTWEKVMEEVRQRRRLLDHNREVLRTGQLHLKHMAREMRSDALSSSFVQEKQIRAKAFDKELESKVDDVLDQCEKVNEETDEQLKLVTKAIDNWWSQPAQQVIKKM